MKNATLCYIFKDGKVLLQKKVKGKFGEGKWNGPGGKIKMLESPKRAAIREVFEETNLKVKDLKECGMLRFEDEKRRSFSVHVFTTNNFTGQPINKGEGVLEWFPIDDIPYHEMWEDDKVWMHHLFRGKKFRFQALFTEGFKNMVDYKIETEV